MLMKRSILFLLFAAATLGLAPAAAVADRATHTFDLEMDAPNFGVAANGDRVAIEGAGEFSVHPKSSKRRARSPTRTAKGTSSQPVRGRRQSSSLTSRTGAESSSETTSPAGQGEGA